MILTALFVRDDGVPIGEPFIKLENFLGQVRVRDFSFNSAGHEIEKVVVMVKRR